MYNTTITFYWIVGIPKHEANLLANEIQNRRQVDKPESRNDNWKVPLNVSLGVQYYDSCNPVHAHKPVFYVSVMMLVNKIIRRPLLQRCVFTHR